MRPITVTAGPLAAGSANAICLSQTPTAGALTLNGTLVVSGVVVMDNPRQVLITTTGNESTRTFTLTGKNWAGDTITETITGPNATTAASVLSYKSVSAITINGNAANALTIGTNGVGESPWVRLDEWALNATAVQCTVSGTVNYTVQQTLQDPNSPTDPVAPSAMTWISSPDTSVVGATTSQQSYYIATPLWTKVLLNSGSGSVTAVFAQGGAVPY